MFGAITQINNILHGEKRMTHKLVDYTCLFIGSACLPLIKWCKIKPVVKQSTDHQSVLLKFKPVVNLLGQWVFDNK